MLVQCCPSVVTRKHDMGGGRVGATCTQATRPPLYKGANILRATYYQVLNNKSSHFIQIHFRLLKILRTGIVVYFYTLK